LTALIHRYQGGDAEALHELMPLVYGEMKKIAAHQGRAARSQTLSSTSLVHEAFLRLHEAGDLVIQDRHHFYAIAARTMRWVLADHARAKSRGKRGGPAALFPIAFDENAHSPEGGNPIDYAALQGALEALERHNPQMCRIFELRQLVGLSIEETAETLGLSARTVSRDWTRAKAWLARELGR
jgi:RNA polymerase sigma factor (TIGR02999 family)